MTKNCGIVALAGPKAGPGPKRQGLGPALSMPGAATGRTTSCTLLIFSCDSHDVGFDFGKKKMKENKRKISRTECPSGAGVAH